MFIYFFFLLIYSRIYWEDTKDYMFLYIKFGLKKYYIGIIIYYVLTIK